MTATKYGDMGRFFFLPGDLIVPYNKTDDEIWGHVSIYDPLKRKGNELRALYGSLVVTAKSVRQFDCYVLFLNKTNELIHAETRLLNRYAVTGPHPGLNDGIRGIPIVSALRFPT